MAHDSDWTWGSIIDAAGGTMRVVDGLGESKSTVSGWRTRPGGIPGKHWSAIVDLAATAGRPDVTLAVLADVAARKVEEARA